MRLLLVFLGFIAGLRASDVPSETVDLNSTPPDPQPTICGDVVQDNLYQGQYWFLASDIIACLISVPFHPEVATRFLTYFNQTMQFQSNLAYMKNPPPGYQQTSVDFNAQLQQIQDKVNAGFYHNQYAFEADVQALSQATHDTHAVVYAGVLNQFTFASPFYLVSVSPDGKQVPQVYVYDDLIECLGPRSNCTASALESINGVPVVDYLTEFAQKNSFGMLEQHADWNQLMASPAQDIIGGTNAFSGGATFYPGDNLVISWQNGTEQTLPWLALYNSPGFTGPLTTGGDFYNYFVLNLPPANYDEELKKFNALFPPPNDTSIDAGSDSQSPGLQSWNSVSQAYPKDTLTRQKYLGTDTSGVITSYFLRDISTAVLSIPSFTEYGKGIDTFSSAVADFISAASDRNATKIIIDLQENNGGQASLAFDTFRQFFPGVTPFAGSRIRSHDMANTLGNTFTNYFQTLNGTNDTQAYSDALYEEWVVTDRINAETGQNFSSWAEFYGPRRLNGDGFSLTQRYNLSSQLFDEDNLGIDFPDCFFTNDCDDQTLWQGKNIVMLTDGTCTSTCALFVEMMAQDAGARTVAVGGRPEPGPMQAASGSRGALSYTSDDLDGDFVEAGQLNTTAVAALPLVRDPGMYITYLGFTLRDQIRSNATVPNQFLYLPADCRIYWTFANFYDYGRLWHDVWNAMYNDTSICVPGSTNVTNPPGNGTHINQKRSTAASDVSIGEFIDQGLSPDSFAEHQGKSDADVTYNYAKPLTFCSRNGRPDQSLCTSGSICQTVDFPCKKSTGPCTRRSCPTVQSAISNYVCLPKCLPTSDQGGNCKANTFCQPTTSTGSMQNSASGGLASPGHSYNVQSGYCVPKVSPTYGCTFLASPSNLQTAVNGGLRR
ncbi:MAG: hypothetical protein M1820_003662 [Bogoriella megaspora]|nr:MAG: hypothetical protein M1820_003662 [Bogoriella megaspora]